MCYAVKRLPSKTYYKFEGETEYKDLHNSLFDYKEQSWANSEQLEEKKFLIELFREGEKFLLSMDYKKGDENQMKKYLSAYPILHKAMRMVCLHDVDTHVPEVVIDYLNFGASTFNKRGR